MLKFYIKTPDEINPETDYLIELSGHNYVNNVDLGRISKISSVDKKVSAIYPFDHDEDKDDHIRFSELKKGINQPTETIINYLITFDDGNFRLYNGKQVLMIGVKE